MERVTVISKDMKEFSFQKPAVYKIVVQGKLDKKWSERVGGMQINIGPSQDQTPVSVLVGQINDQAALSGVLNTLYEYHVTIISVNMLNENINNYENENDN
jgi:hypothetical protein